MSEQEFSWGDLGELWWRENGEACRATEQQIRFACARHQNCNKSKAAALAGYSGDSDALRSAGVRADGTTAVKDLLALAAATEGPGADSAMTDAEVNRRINKMIRGNDGPLSLKAIEARDKRLAAAQAQAGEFKQPEPEELAKFFLGYCRPETAALVWGEFVLRAYHWHAPGLREFVPYLKAHHPADWQVYRKVLSGDYDQMAADCDRLEKYPLLSLDEILAKAGVGDESPARAGKSDGMSAEDANAAV